jgi:hypothetical protein
MERGAGKHVHELFRDLFGAAFLRKIVVHDSYSH